MKYLNLIAVISLLSGATLSAQITVNFDSSNALDPFIQNSTGELWSLSNSGGNSGGFLQTSGDNAFSTLGAALSLDTTNNRNFSLSIDFLTGSGTTSARRALLLGISNSNTLNYGGGGYTEQSAVNVGLYPDINNGPNNFRYYSGTSNPNAVDGLSVGSNDDLLTHTWYNLRSDWTYTQSTDSFDIVLSLTKSGESSPFRSVPIGTDIANPFGENPTLYAFFGGRDTLDVNVTGVDNFMVSGDIISNVTPVPEPGHFAAITGLLGILFLAYRRCRKA